jgi:glycosyltransferase involved in cell wall biosynthesis
VLGECGVPALDIKQLGWQVHVVNENASSKYGQIVKLRQIFRENKIQVVHSHNTYAQFYASIAAKITGVPVILNTQHGRGCGPNWKAKLQFKIANLLSDKVLAVSEDARLLCQNQDTWNKRKIETLWNGIDVKRFAYHGPALRGPAITVSRLSPEKDLTSMLHAVYLVVKTKPEFKLRIVGEGKERPKLEALCKELQIEKNVELLGERQDVPELLAESSFYVGSTLSEGISLTLLEAMAIGLPIVTTNVGGNPEIVVDGETGILVNPSQPKTLAEGILNMYEHQHRWATMSEAGRKRVEKNFDINRMIREYEQLYQTLLREKRMI